MLSPPARLLYSARERHRLDALDPALLDRIAAAMTAAGRIDATLCGAVYETRLAADRTRRRASGTYYTPPHLVDLVLARTLGTTLASRPPKDPFALTIVDPACGGGAFLLAAIDHLAQGARHLAEGARRSRRGVRALDNLAEFQRRAVGCVIGVDVDAVAVDVCRLAVAVAFGGAEARVVCADGLLDEVAGIPDGAVDVVVGNPPWGQKGFRFAAGVAARLRERYVTASGVLDPFKLFVERAVGMVRPGGRWGMVLPDVVLLKDQERLRRLILERCAIEHVVDAGRAFPGVNLDAVVIAARRMAPAAVPARHRVAIWHRLPADWRAAPPETVHLEQRVFVRQPGQRFNLHLTPASLALLDRLAPLPRLGASFEVHEGVHTGNARARLFRRARPAGAAARVVVGGDELRRFRIAWGGTWLDLDPRAVDRGRGGYANLGRPAWHRAGKLVVRRTGDRIVAARDRDGLWFSNNAFVVLPRAAMRAAELAAWTALLDSAAITWWFRTVQPRTGRLFAELKIIHLVDVPRPADAAWRRAVPTLARLTARAERAAGRAADLAPVDAAIDAAVADAFAFTPVERALVERPS